LFCNSLCRLSRLNQTLVVKISDTSHPEERAGSNPAFDARTVEVPRQGLPRATAQVFSKGAPVLPSLTPISPVPQRALSIAGVKNVGKAVVKMPVTSR
jgi:hypothetical protein